jgi:predicted O-methyltransferase YrrM
MQKALFQIQAWLRYQLQAKGRHGVHSPFVYTFIDQVLKPVSIEKQERETVKKIEQLRRERCQDQRILEVEDFGAGLGGKQTRFQQRPVAAIAKSSARSPLYGILLYRLCDWWKPNVCLEMGTNLGFSTLYQMYGAPHARMITMEGSPAIADIANSHFKSAGFEPEIILGEFSKSFENFNPGDASPDYIFIDGNHRKDPTVAYFQFLMNRCAPASVFIFDDIHWSPGMEAAWDIIRADPRVQVSIDVFGMGLCFTGRDQAKEHFVLRYP